MAKYFADTYALIEILKGNPNYRKYSAEELYTTEFNLLELSYALVRDFGYEKAEEVLKIVRSAVNVVSPSLCHYVLASDMRIREKKKGKKLSLVDCLGYVVAKSLGMKFLTGDREFKEMENVEFVK
ncbi:PIN domain-containing protein [Thermococcus sp. SY098]|uniref:PIN domain-containing protein n=1 Tax=Thermococcus sp. SY098 TaxID=3111325 RepID=UPI002D781B28|nr:PIN domain-containing protein [Thermococcus sp. SY098]WRS52469.1 PIN domain-containing protein [Thermococcus sp. SY098]